jgi:hypothetical protein
MIHYLISWLLSNSKGDIRFFETEIVGMFEFFCFLIKVILLVKITPWMTCFSGFGRSFFVIRHDLCFGFPDNLVICRYTLFCTVYPSPVEDVAGSSVLELDWMNKVDSLHQEIVVLLCLLLL